MRKKIDKKQRQTIIYICMHAQSLFNNVRWPGGVTCPYCGAKHIWHYKNGTYKSRRNSRIPLQLEKIHVVPPSSQDEALSRYSVSGEVPR